MHWIVFLLYLVVLLWSSSRVAKKLKTTLLEVVEANDALLGATSLERSVFGVSVALLHFVLEPFATDFKANSAAVFATL